MKYIKSKKYLLEILTDRFQITNNLDNKTVLSTIISNDCVAFITTDNYILNVIYEKDDERFYVNKPYNFLEWVFSNIINYIICEVSRGLYYKVMDVITHKEFLTLQVIMNEEESEYENKLKEYETKQSEIKQAKEIITKYPDIFKNLQS